MNALWQPVTIPANEPDPRGPGLDFNLTPNERSQAAIAKCHLIRHVKRLNEADRAAENEQTARDLGVALERDL